MLDKLIDNQSEKVINYNSEVLSKNNYSINKKKHLKYFNLAKKASFKKDRTLKFSRTHNLFVSEPINLLLDKFIKKGIKGNKHFYTAFSRLKFDFMFNPKSRKSRIQITSNNLGKTRPNRFLIYALNNVNYHIRKNHKKVLKAKKLRERFYYSYLPFLTLTSFQTYYFSTYLTKNNKYNRQLPYFFWDHASLNLIYLFKYLKLLKFNIIKDKELLNFLILKLKLYIFLVTWVINSFYMFSKVNFIKKEKLNVLNLVFKEHEPNSFLLYSNKAFKNLMDVFPQLNKEFWKLQYIVSSKDLYGFSNFFYIKKLAFNELRNKLKKFVYYYHKWIYCMTIYDNFSLKKTNKINEYTNILNYYKILVINYYKNTVNFNLENKKLREMPNYTNFFKSSIVFRKRATFSFLRNFKNRKPNLKKKILGKFDNINKFPLCLTQRHLFYKDYAKDIIFKKVVFFGENKQCLYKLIKTEKIVNSTEKIEELTGDRFLYTFIKELRTHNFNNLFTDFCQGNLITETIIFVKQRTRGRKNKKRRNSRIVAPIKLRGRGQPAKFLMHYLYLLIKILFKKLSPRKPLHVIIYDLFKDILFDKSLLHSFILKIEEQVVANKYNAHYVWWRKNS